MSLAPGARIGAYDIAALIGAGGMGEVYRARDTRLGRDVAIKILPDAFAADADRVLRFQREAQVLASLNHPNIAHIYGIEDASAGVRALVLELVDGPTLADRIAAAPRGIPIEDALPIARQIATALEAAHENGVVHRDLKPANIKLTHDGVVKVLDFGLAKASGGSAGFQADPSASPTITSPAMATHAGIILGTAVYMSPEQAKGKPADKRSDVWAFGCVLYEMLSGRRAFDGEDLTDVVAAVVRGEPDWTALPEHLPAHIRALLKGCLEKDRKARIGDIAVARFLLDHGAAVPAARTASAAPPRPTSRAMFAAAAAIVLLALAVAGAALWRSSLPPASDSPVRLTADVGAEAFLVDTLGASSILSPDGSVLVFSATTSLNGNSALYTRPLNHLQASLLSGTEGAFNPFFSPDGRSVGFFAGGKLKKISISGGPAVTLADAVAGRGGSWGEDGVIFFSPAGQPNTPLQRVSSEGGTSEKPFALVNGEVTQRWPQVLPGANALIFTSAKSLGNFGDAQIVLQPLPAGSRKVLMQNAYYGRYVASGHLLFFRDRTLYAAPFDAGTLDVTGPAVPVIEGVRSNSIAGGAQFDVSATGRLVYTAGSTQADTAPIRWLDRSGKLTMMRSTPSNWSNPAVSPDGRLLAIDIHDGTQSDIWIYDWERDTLSKRTFDNADDARPIWSPDGSRIAFTSTRGEKSAFNLYWQRADGTGDAERLTTNKNSQWPTSFHPNGRLLAFLESPGGGAGDVMMLPLEGDEKTGWKPGTPTPFLNAAYGESSAAFSPDGRWVAYISNQGGRNDIFVQPFPGPGGKYQLTSSAADDPLWSRTSSEFFFLNTADLRVMAMPYRVDGGTFVPGKPAPIAETRVSGRPRAPSRDLDVHPDGQRFVVAGTDSEAQRLDRLVFVFNFFDELRRIAPAKGSQ